MKARLAIVICLVLAAGGGYAAWRWSHTRDRSLKTWMKRLHSPSDLQVQEAVTAISNLGPEAQAAVPDLIWLLENGGPAHRKNVVIALGNIGPEARAAVPALAALLPKCNGADFKETASTLTVFGDDALPAVPALLEALLTHDVNRVENAGAALMAIGPAVVPDVTAALKHENRWMRMHAAAVLGLMGEKASSAVPELQRLSEDPDEHVREVAAKNIRKIEQATAAKRN